VSVYKERIYFGDYVFLKRPLRADLNYDVCVVWFNGRLSILRAENPSEGYSVNSEGIVLQDYKASKSGTLTFQIPIAKQLHFIPCQ